jgi:hypothetical protein
MHLEIKSDHPAGITCRNQHAGANPRGGYDCHRVVRSWIDVAVFSRQRRPEAAPRVAGTGFLDLVRIMQCAPTARITSGGRITQRVVD